MKIKSLVLSIPFLSMASVFSFSVRKGFKKKKKDQKTDKKSSNKGTKVACTFSRAVRARAHMHMHKHY